MAHGTPGMTTEDLQAFADAWNRHDIDAIMAFMTDDCVFESSAGPDVCGTRSAGRDAVRAAFVDVWTNFPDAHWGNARHFVEGDRGVSEWTFTGTRRDGSRVEVHGCDLFTIREGRIALKDSYRKHRPPTAVDFAPAGSTPGQGTDEPHMEMRMKITVETLVRAELDRVWKAWNDPEDIKLWNSAQEDWHTTRSTVDLREGGTFMSRMEAKDGSVGFDFEGTYTHVVPKSAIAYRMSDGREVEVEFIDRADGVLVREMFDAETENTLELQRQGWQAILDNFGGYVEGKGQ